jgi:hypothetical protein
VDHRRRPLELVGVARVREAVLAPAPALTATDEQRAAAVIEVGFGEGESLLDAQTCAPEDHDQAA